jgi:hypothetical protein
VRHLAVEAHHARAASGPGERAGHLAPHVARSAADVEERKVAPALPRGS